MAKKDFFNDTQKTKIVATIGPASRNKATILGLVKAGVDVVRLNFSHGTHEDHQKVIDIVLDINSKYDASIGLLADLQGPKLRIGKMKNDGVMLKKGDKIDFVNKECIGSKTKAYMSYKEFPRDVKVGDKILVDDGKLVFKVLSSNKKDSVKLETVFGGKLSPLCSLQKTLNY